MSKRQIGFIIFSVFVMFTFQNCAPSFRAHVGTETLLSQGDNLPPEVSPTPLPDGTIPTPTPPPGTTPTPTPTPPTAKVLLETRFYFGGTNQIQGFKINHANDAVMKQPRYTMNAGGIGWINYEPTNQIFLAADNGNADRYSRNTYNPMTGALSNFVGTGPGPTSTHMTLIKGTNGFIVYSASYGGAFLRKNNFDAAMNIVAGSATQIDYAAGAKTHSSAFDSKRNLLFVANLGLNQINSYKVNLTTGALTPTGVHMVTAPRTVIYDAAYDKLYLATEASAGASYIHGYTIAEAGASVTLTTVGSLAMPLIGADIKVDHKNRFVMATARENAKESVWALPVTETGVQDASRPSFTFNVNQPFPRAIEISEDGKYVFIGSSAGNATANVQVFKMTYDATLKFVGAQMIYQDLVANGQFNCSLSIPIYQ